MTRLISAGSISFITTIGLISPSNGFALNQISDRGVNINSKLCRNQSFFALKGSASRADFLKACAFGTGSIILGFPQATLAIPAVTTREFNIILKDSSKSVESVVFFGSKGDKAIVTLLDGTTFSISDLFESPVDPRSPLKLAATCRNYGVNTKFELLEGLAKKDGRNRVYMNSRMAEAEVKNQAKKKRMALDEAARIEAVENYEASTAPAPVPVPEPVSVPEPLPLSQPEVRRNTDSPPQMFVTDSSSQMFSVDSPPQMFASDSPQMLAPDPPQILAPVSPPQMRSLIPVCGPDEGACLSTSSTKDIMKFAAPWEYDSGVSSPGNVLVALKRAIVRASGSITEENDGYLRADVNGFEMQYQVRTDGVVTYKMAQAGGFRLPGGEKVIRTKLDEVKTVAGVFGRGGPPEGAVAKEEGALGQLKAFYGIQSGLGSEELLNAN
eukprot:CAMPEP_0194267320 /NCGR_PEP_ID=MMETSP0169-20130528/1875_1 /TAXON_ID=218684 /ORGANISM="Corethron pennatum, Strain L29A3" /LENGTH=440 /DNA_ID=CAMNT_0039008145 /DNA_START=107 /DNA_END=1429 /DNA_ORIENTATION=+